MHRIPGLFVDLARHEDAASAAEYALIPAIVTTGIAAATIALGDNVSLAIGRSAACIANQIACPTG